VNPRPACRCEPFLNALTEGVVDDEFADVEVV
jgi:hypothetical protein